MTAPNYALNVSATDRCFPCDDTGFVELKGTITRHGVAYSRGTAPCKWCEQGRRRYARMVELRQHPESNFGIEDVEGWDADDRPVGRDEARRYIAAIQAQWSKPRPGEQALRIESNAEIERKRRQAEQALQAEPELPPDPVPTQPDYSDVPF